jgi:uncharacterized protein involved in oxidation of intracellular sulfur
MPKLVLVGTTGTENPTKAVLPFVLANGALKAKEPIEVTIALLGDAVVLLKGAVIERLQPLGYPPLKELLAGVQERSVPIYV